MAEDALSTLESDLAAAKRRIKELEYERDALRQAESAARLSEERLRFVLAASRAGAWDLDLPTKTVRLSNDCKAIYGIAPDGCYDRDAFIAAIVPEDRDRYRCAIRTAVRNASDLEISYRFTRPDGTIRWVEVRGRPITAFDGSKVSLSGIAIDVTERKRAEAGVVEQEARYRAITDSIDQMIWSTQPDGYHDYFNHRWYEYTGVPAGSTDGAGWNDMLHADDRDHAWTEWRKCLGSGEPYLIEYRLKHRSGIYRWVLGRAQPVRDDSGAIVRWYGTCTDIHDFKMAGERIRELEERYRLASPGDERCDLGMEFRDRADLMERVAEGILRLRHSGWPGRRVAALHPSRRRRPRPGEHRRGDPRRGDTVELGLPVPAGRRHLC